MEAETLRAMQSLGLMDAELSIVFVSSRAMRGLNLEYRGIDSTTDVLSFPLHDFKGRPSRFKRQAGQVGQAGQAGQAASPPGEALLLGDIIIDPERAREQATEIGHSLFDEIIRLIVHGLLHLLGYDHEGGKYERQKMRKAEMRLMESLS